MAALKWTKKIPTEEGRYWWRADAVDKEPMLLDVYRVGGGKLEVNKARWLYGCTPTQCGGQWAGPVAIQQPPEENN